MFRNFSCFVVLALVGTPSITRAAESISLLPSTVRLRAEQGYYVQSRLEVKGTTGISGLSASWSGGSWFMSVLSSTKVPAYIQMTGLATSLQPGTYSGSLTLRSSVTAANNPQVIRVELQVTPRASRYPVSIFRDSLGVIRSSEFGLSFTSSGATQASDPSSSQASTGETFVVARSSANSIAANVYFPATRTWSNWQVSGGSIAGRPAVAAVSSIQAYAVARDSSGAYWTLPFSRTSGFGSWASLGGVLATDPAAAACYNGDFWVAGRDQSGNVWVRQFRSGSGWGNWTAVGSGLQGSPGLTCGTDNAAYIAARDTSNVLRMIRYSGTTISPSYAATGLAVTGDPALAVSGLGVVFAVVTDAAQAVWYRPFTEGTGNNWTQWMKAGGNRPRYSAAAVRGLLYIPGADPYGNLSWYRSSPAAWTASPGAIVGGALSSAPY